MICLPRDRVIVLVKQCSSYIVCCVIKFYTFFSIYQRNWELMQYGLDIFKQHLLWYSWLEDLYMEGSETFSGVEQQWPWPSCQRLYPICCCQYQHLSRYFFFPDYPHCSCMQCKVYNLLLIYYIHKKDRDGICK